MTLNRKQQGFTIVELLIVIVVIGILAALVITSFTGIQQKGRNTERTTDIKALHSSVENYYALNGSYPDATDLATDAWITANLKGLDLDAARDPKGQNPAANDIVSAAPVAGTFRYSYVVTATGGGACTTAAGDCAVYALTAVMENGDPNFVKNNLN